MAELMVPMPSNMMTLLLPLARIQNTLVIMDCIKHSRHLRCFIYMDIQRPKVGLVHMCLTAHWIVIPPLFIHHQQSEQPLLRISLLRLLQVLSWAQCGLLTSIRLLLPERLPRFFYPRGMETKQQGCRYRIRERGVWRMGAHL